MATKKKTVAKKPAPAKKASKPAPKAASKPAAKPVAKKAVSRNASTPKWVNDAIKFAEKNPTVALGGLVAVALGLMLIFG